MLVTRHVSSGIHPVTSAEGGHGDVGARPHPIDLWTMAAPAGKMPMRCRLFGKIGSGENAAEMPALWGWAYRRRCRERAHERVFRRALVTARSARALPAGGVAQGSKAQQLHAWYAVRSSSRRRAQRCGPAAPTQSQNTPPRLAHAFARRLTAAGCSPRVRCCHRYSARRRRHAAEFRAGGVQSCSEQPSAMFGEARGAQTWSSTAGARTA